MESSLTDRQQKKAIEFLIDRDMSLSEIAIFFGVNKIDVLMTIVKFCNERINIDDGISDMVDYFTMDIQKSLPGLSIQRYIDLVVEKLSSSRKETETLTL
jgi:predicted DNA-binding protein YlxM (UPF0122 family)